MQQIPQTLAYVYLGTGADGCVASGVIGAIHGDGTTELWEQQPNLGMVMHLVKTDSLEQVFPLHPLPAVTTAADYHRVLDGMIDEVHSLLAEPVACSDELRRIARRIEYLADFVDFSHYTEQDEQKQDGGPEQ